MVRGRKDRTSVRCFLQLKAELVSHSSQLYNESLSEARRKKNIFKQLSNNIDIQTKHNKESLYYKYQL